MKKIIPFIFPLITGLFGGWFIECFLCVASITMSPFGDLDQFNFFSFLWYSFISISTDYHSGYNCEYFVLY